MKKLLHFLILTLITLCFNGCFWGRGWLMPYSFQPSYHKFKKMCKLNELPNDEYKYNKILAYFDTSLDTIDWEELNEKTWKFSTTNGFYKKGVFEYMTETDWIKQNTRIEKVARFLSNESKINRYNINAMYFVVIWHTRRSYLRLAHVSYKLEWNEIELSCTNITPLKYDYAERIK